MIVLAIDTCLFACSAAVVQDGAVQSAVGLLGPGDTLLMGTDTAVRLVAKAEVALIMISLTAQQRQR